MLILDRKKKKRRRKKPIPGYKWCKYCGEDHPTTEEYWEFRASNGRPWRCKFHRKMEYLAKHQDEAKEWWAGLSEQEKSDINRRRRNWYRNKRLEEIKNEKAI